MTPSNVRRSDHSAKQAFARIANAALQDQRLSFRARGVLAYVLSKPDNWTHSAERLAAVAQEGRDAIVSAISELKSLGYCRKIVEREPSGCFKTRLTFFELPQAEEAAPSTQGADTGKPVVGPTTENQAPVSRSLENRQSVDRASVSQASLKRLSNNDCIETTVEEQKEETRSGAELIPIHSNPPAARNDSGNEFTSAIQAHVHQIAERQNMTNDGVAGAFEHWCRLKAMWFAKDGVTPRNAHLHFESWLTSTKQGRAMKQKHVNYDNAW